MKIPWKSQAVGDGPIAFGLSRGHAIHLPRLHQGDGAILQPYYGAKNGGFNHGNWWFNQQKLWFNQQEWWFYSKNGCFTARMVV